MLLFCREIRELCPEQHGTLKQWYGPDPTENPQEKTMGELAFLDKNKKKYFWHSWTIALPPNMPKSVFRLFILRPPGPN